MGRPNKVSVTKLATGEQGTMSDLPCLTHSSSVGKLHTISVDYCESSYSSCTNYVPLYFPQGHYLNVLDLQQNCWKCYETSRHITL